MFSAGLVEEVRGLLGGPRPLSKTARQAVGYREVIEHLGGRADLDETIELVKLHTRQLAKRQGTWFRSLSECRLLRCGARSDAAAVAEHVAARDEGLGIRDWGLANRTLAVSQESPAAPVTSRADGDAGIKQSLQYVGRLVGDEEVIAAPQLVVGGVVVAVNAVPIDPEEFAARHLAGPGRAG